MKNCWSLLVALLASGLITSEATSQTLFPVNNKQPIFDYNNTLRRSILSKISDSRYLSISGGTVVMAFKIERSGKIIESFLLKSSSDPHIDRAAMKVFTTGAQFPPFPEEMKARWLNISFPMRFPPR